MQKNKTVLLNRLEKLKDTVSKPFNNFDQLPEQVQHIIKTAPQTLSDLEIALNQENPQDLLVINEVFNQLEMFIRWAVGVAAGKSMAESIRSGSLLDPTASAQQRLNQRMTKFLVEHIDEKRYLDLVKEFCGEEAVQGNTIYMDPTRESEAFAQWIVCDKVVPGFPKRLIELFADETLNDLPSDERHLLESQLQDRPSIYRVVKMDENIEKQKGMYFAQDILSQKKEDFLCIQDRATSISLAQGAIFIGRAIPTNKEPKAYLLLGSITELPEKLWQKLSVFVQRWKEEYFFSFPHSSSTAFFRAYHARIRNFIYR
jgi:hypothetical protein